MHFFKVARGAARRRGRGAGDLRRVAGRAARRIEAARLRARHLAMLAKRDHLLGTYMEQLSKTLMLSYS